MKIDKVLGAEFMKYDLSSSDISVKSSRFSLDA